MGVCDERFADNLGKIVRKRCVTLQMEGEQTDHTPMGPGFAGENGSLIERAKKEKLHYGLWQF